ncbi:MAG TPA: type II toxin-antitoxin system PemK/MazF family toxin [Solirubrobacterales bacterium]|nr:type II toxin-antitoxin system PemK/MazF family toxin [Solirubrobacterales bacterium]
MIRGDVHEVNLRRGAGRVQHGRRYAVIVQANDLLSLSTVVICPTSRSAQEASFRPEVKLNGEKTKVLCEMVRPFDVRKLGDRIGHLSLDELAAVDEALGLVLDLA